MNATYWTTSGGNLARANQDRDTAPTLAAAATWMQECLINDGSLFSDAALWEPSLLESIKSALVDHPQEGPDDFIKKLKRQLQFAPKNGRCLMAEVLWALLLFPTSVAADTKRRQILEVWRESGLALASDHPLLQDRVLVGIGSGGPGFNNHRWRELEFIIDLALDLKRYSTDKRKEILSSYDAFMSWIEAAPQKGHRQYRHMLRYFAFPEVVERMSSNKNRKEILSAFGIASRKETSKWSDRQLDTALSQLRKKLEDDSPGQTLDFYNAPLRSRWIDDDSTDANKRKREEHQSPKLVHETPREYKASSGLARNVIYYGPPGTGKTYLLRGLMHDYTDVPARVDQQTWLNDILANYGWRPVVVVALSRMHAPTKVGELLKQPLVLAKAVQRGIDKESIQPTLWGYLQEHTPEDVQTVRVATRRPPFVFSKSEEGLWSVLPEWASADEKAAELAARLDAGSAGAKDDIRRFRSVTFHPSYSYEDFVRGIRPIPVDEGRRTEFRLVDGIFKKLCDEARANPTKQYALFIDEINRANIAKVFGELISLIEPDKRLTIAKDGRLEGLTVQLLGGDESDAMEPPFGVPANLDIYGSMNTADRSIALLDVALRRRFEFHEMEPEYTLIDREIDGIHLGHLLRTINDRLEFLLDRDHRIGHAYFYKVQTLKDLQQVFKLQVIPLLQEYFFEDFARIAQVLSTTSSASMIEKQTLSYSRIFPRATAQVRDRFRYIPTPDVTWLAETFRGVYIDHVEVDSGDDAESSE